ncbi:MAG: helix-turn-helix domain-containing protein [Phoenicibacter congonensis]|uniref:Helix-turn-helix domain-containing protein n=1 Tax=Phoenicibacter congonensis TaxID=1944646 RepID=A0AA43RKH6_9ACTN|nr:helix-turn-helix domain-containing protein [Phoenicibacter congonensis]
MMNLDSEQQTQNTTFANPEIQECVVLNPARVAVYDDFKSSPRIIEVQPQDPKDFIGELGALIYKESQQAGGTIAYSVIKQITENLIHAQFKEIVISIFPGGKEIRFTDQGPGIINKDDVLRPGFSTATREMKQYIDGVGSGLPIAKEYLEANNGEITIENNLVNGAVITLKEHTEEKIPAPVIKPAAINVPSFTNFIAQDITQRQIQILEYLFDGQLAGNNEIAENLGIPQSSVYNDLRKLQDLKYVEKVGKKRIITALGRQVIDQLKQNA